MPPLRGGPPTPMRFISSRTISTLLLLLAGLLIAAAPADPPEAAALERGRALARRGSWSHEDVLGLLALQLVDPERFAGDEGFRRRVLGFLPRALDPKAPAGLRDALLTELNQVRGFDFAASDEVERAWGAVPRRGADRRVGFARRRPALRRRRRRPPRRLGLLAAVVLLRSQGRGRLPLRRARRRSRAYPGRADRFAAARRAGAARQGAPSPSARHLRPPLLPLAAGPVHPRPLDRRRRAGAGAPQPPAGPGGGRQPRPRAGAEPAGGPRPRLGEGDVDHGAGAVPQRAGPAHRRRRVDDPARAGAPHPRPPRASSGCPSRASRRPRGSTATSPRRTGPRRSWRASTAGRSASSTPCRPRQRGTSPRGRS